MGSTPVGISASRGAAILGLSKYKSPLLAWLEIMEQKIPGFCNNNGYMKPERIDPWLEPLNPKSASLRWGLGFEDAINNLVGGVTDREKVAVGGHSYGAFMTANLLAHSRLFAAGIARSGAYNRTLTPFGFQAEPRTYWEAPEIYYNMSPFMHADQVKDPILLIQTLFYKF